MTSVTLLPRGGKEERLIPPQAVDAFLDALSEQGLELHSFMLLRHGKVAAEGWWAPYSADYPHTLFSLSKSFTSTAVGIAAAEGLLDVHDKVASFFPEEAPERPTDYLAAMEVRHLLTMSTGHAKCAMEWARRHEPKHWVKGFLHAPVDYEPGTHFVYNNGASYMLSAIVQKVTGESMLDYLRPRLFEPLGIVEAAWETCPRGISKGGWGLSLISESIAKFGELLLRKGNWNGRQLVPEAWVEAATSKMMMANDGGIGIDWTQGYGYQFWQCRHGAFRGDGMFGQFCIVLPQQDAVIAMTAATSRMQAVLNAVWEHLLTGLGGEGERELPSVKEESYDMLLKRLGSQNVQPFYPVTDSVRESALNNKRYTFASDDDGIQSIQFQFERNEIRIEVQMSKKKHAIRCGKGEWVYSEAVFEGKLQPVAASCGWEAPDLLSVNVCVVETPFRLTATFRFEEDLVRMDWGRNVPERPREHKTGRIVPNDPG
ncbi:serine hydrolase domain-containing protein [Paenibacillus ginsengarvi]|uniref:Class C beta-lactamase-related serine hydrolase n=1 Tax=Paenibacillus ginsengarvi TaxID=400777 RepID=A0A3B0C4B4_9BACL|nr:serine hydrolase [Paenibacillus ginsengarvi]RKN79104.1 class C beta-lactamase-related serine hydrolase [Paenibacillus ginsengarvi]